MVALLPAAVIENDIKGPRHGDDQLMEILVRMAAPFGTAGKAACTDPHGINGSFSLDATHHTWSCFYDVPPNPRGDLSALVTACDTDAGTLLTLQLDASPLKNWAARCVNE